MGKDESYNLNHKSEQLKLKDYSYSNQIPKKRKPMQCSNCKQCRHKKLRCIEVRKSCDKVSDKKTKKGSG